MPLRQLTGATDALVVAVQDSPAGKPANANGVTPTRNYKSDYDRLCERFKNLGYYGVADPLVLERTQAMIGDAIDDLTDIGSDLRKVLWHHEN